MNEIKQITVMGATGSIGKNTLSLIRQFPEKFSVFGLVAGRNVEQLARLTKEFNPKIVGINDERKLPVLRELLKDLEVDVVAGEEECTKIASIPVDLIVAGIIGFAGLSSVIAAVDAGQVVALANKEALVSAGAIVMSRARTSGAKILPLDSEHNAIFQCWNGWRDQNTDGNFACGISEIEQICLTASGGPFLDLPKNKLSDITPSQALRHPNWKMGKKISVDSATMMNKGLEVIEAHWLFSVEPERIDVLIHPQQAIHGLVYFCDGSVVAQLASADMRTPISFALSWPGRLPWLPEKLDLAKLHRLEFVEVDFENFRCFWLAREALKEGGVQPTVLNAANEVAVSGFLDNRISFNQIPVVVEDCLSKGLAGDLMSVDAVCEIDKTARRIAETFIERY